MVSPVKLIVPAAPGTEATRGDRVRFAREMRKISQRELGEMIGLTHRSIGKIEGGGDTRYISSIAQALGVSRNWLEQGDGHYADATDSPMRFVAVLDAVGDDTGRTMPVPDWQFTQRSESEFVLYETASDSVRLALLNTTDPPMDGDMLVASFPMEGNTVTVLRYWQKDGGMSVLTAIDDPDCVYRVAMGQVRVIGVVAALFL